LNHLPTPAEALFAFACSVIEPAEWSRRSQLFDALDRPTGWDAFRALALDHKLVPILARNLAWASHLLNLNLPPLDELQLIRRASLTHNLRRKAELIEICRALDARDIPFVPLKGAVLAAEVFGSLSLRMFDDNDA
jgi:hypothetical protein